jgi:hypothetical protein
LVQNAVATLVLIALTVLSKLNLFRTFNFCLKTWNCDFSQQFDMKKKEKRKKERVYPHLERLKIVLFV